MNTEATDINSGSTPTAPTLPANCQPLFLATQSCELFQLRPQVDVTADQPRKLLSKQQLLADIQQRRAVSDFQPFKSWIDQYPDDQGMLIVYDAEWVYGQNFYLCLTVEAMQAILNPKTDAQTENADAQGIQDKNQAARAQGWVCLGTDKEMEAEQLPPPRPPRTLLVSRPIHLFRQPCHFEEDGPDIHHSEHYVEFKYANEQISDVKRVEISCAVQARPHLLDHATQTTWNRPVHLAIQYEPNTLDTQQLSAIQQQDTFQETIHNLEKHFDWALRENALVDLFYDHYHHLDHEDNLNVDKGVNVHLPELHAFTDLKHTKNRSVSCIQWHPTLPGLVAVSCTPRSTLDEKVEALHRVKARQALITFWNVAEPLRAQLFLEAPDEVLAFGFHPGDPFVLFAGCSNGQIAIWDITDYQDRLRSVNKKEENDIKLSLRGDFDRERSNEAPTVRYSALSAIDASHRGPVTDLLWVPAGLRVKEDGTLQELPSFDGNDPASLRAAREHPQLVSLSLDGDACFWDAVSKKELKTVEATWQPFHRMSMTSLDGTYEYGATKLSLTACLPRADTWKKSQGSLTASGTSTTLKPIASTKFYCGTEEGDLLYGNWIVTKNKEDKETNTEAVLSPHFGAVSDVQRSPFFQDILISIGGWSLHIFRETVLRGPLLSYEQTQAALTVSQWSLSRPGVFFVGRTDGVLEIWDLMDRCDAPLSTQTVSAHPIASLSLQSQQISSGGRSGKSTATKQFLAVGDDFGTLFVLEVPKRLTKPQRNELGLVRALLDREVKRLTYVVEQRTIFEKARALMLKKQEELAKQMQQASSAASADPTAPNPPAPGQAATSAPAAVVPAKKSLYQFERDKIEKDYGQMEKQFLDVVKAAAPVIR